MSRDNSATVLAARLKALADETRLQMLALLSEHRELCVCDFEHVLGISQSKASRHLRYLYHARLVDERRQGVWIYYRLADNLEPALRAVIKNTREALDPELLADLNKRLEEWIASESCNPRCFRMTS